MHTWLQGDLRVELAFDPTHIVCASCQTLQRVFLGPTSRFQARLNSTCSVPLSPGYPTSLLRWSLSLVGTPVA